MRNHLPSQAGEPVDDTLPHLLLAKLEQPYNTEAFAEITAQTPVHKLDRRLSFQLGTFGAHLKQLFDPTS